MSMGGGKMNLRELCAEYSREIIFGAVLLVCVCLSYWLAHYIPMHLYGRLSMIMNGCIITICLAGACADKLIYFTLDLSHFLGGNFEVCSLHHLRSS